MATSRRSQMTSQRPWRYQGQLYYGISSADAVGVCAVPVPAPVPYQIRLGRGVWTVSSVGGAGYYVFVGGGLTTRVWLAACSASVAALATTRSVRITQVQSTGRCPRECRCASRRRARAHLRTCQRRSACRRLWMLQRPAGAAGAAGVVGPLCPGQRRARISDRRA